MESIPRPVRLDRSRKLNDLRPLTCDQGLISAADGSCRLSQGDTVVLAAVHGPKKPRNPSLEHHDKAFVTVSAQTGSGAPPGPPEREIEQVVREVCEAVIRLEDHPRTAISIVLHIVDDSGSVLAAAVNATCLALLDAGVPLRCLFSALCCGMEAGDSPTVTMDVVAGEEAVLSSTATVVYRATVDASGTPAADPDAILAVITTGPFSPDAFDRLMASACAGCTAVLSFMAEARAACVGAPPA